MSSFHGRALGGGSLMASGGGASRSSTREALGARAESGVSAKCLSDAQGGGDARGRILRQVHVLAGRAPDRQATVERGDRQVGRLRELLRAALEQHPVTRDEQALGGERRGIVLDEVRRPRLERIAARGAKRGEQLKARGAAEARQ